MGAVQGKFFQEITTQLYNCNMQQRHLLNQI